MKQIPNFLTLLNLFFGCIALICILQNGITIMYSADGIQYVDIPEKIWLAPLFIALAAAADFVDGFAARLMKVNSPLGRELDSLADLVSFGVAPGMILYQFLRMSFMRQADGADVSMCAQGFQRAVVITAAVTQTVATRVEGEQRYEKDARMRDGPIGRGFGDSECAALQFAARRPVMENKRRAFGFHTREGERAAG